jgi:hypothetical protein
VSTASNRGCIRTVVLRDRPYLLYATVELMRWARYRLPNQRFLIHWACINEDAA